MESILKEINNLDDETRAALFETADKSVHNATKFILSLEREAIRQTRQGVHDSKDMYLNVMVHLSDEDIESTLVGLKYIKSQIGTATTILFIEATRRKLNAIKEKP